MVTFLLTEDTKNVFDYVRKVERAWVRIRPKRVSTDENFENHCYYFVKVQDMSEVTHLLSNMKADFPHNKNGELFKMLSTYKKVKIENLPNGHHIDVFTRHEFVDECSKVLCTSEKVCYFGDKIPFNRSFYSKYPSSNEYRINYAKVKTDYWKGSDKMVNGFKYVDIKFGDLKDLGGFVNTLKRFHEEGYTSYKVVYDFNYHYKPSIRLKGKRLETFKEWRKRISRKLFNEHKDYIQHLNKLKRIREYDRNQSLKLKERSKEIDEEIERLRKEKESLSKRKK